MEKRKVKYRFLLILLMLGLLSGCASENVTLSEGETLTTEHDGTESINQQEAESRDMKAAN
ncbi:MAG: hypothetical protein Q4B70_13725 [Lachnospiraceae bacterium]|nr:hypothetical protein [Lachnospiraceae bacterium]